MCKSRFCIFAFLAVVWLVLAGPARSFAQQELGPKVEKTYGEGLPRDRSRLIFRRFPVPRLAADRRSSKQYASINGARMKQHVVNLAQHCPSLS